MASWKLSILVLLAVLFVLALEAEGGRRHARRRQNNNNSDNSGAAVGRRRGGRRRGGNREVSTAVDDTPAVAPEGTDNDDNAASIPRRAGGGGGGGRRGGRGRGRPGRGRGGRRGGRGRGAGGRRRGGRRPNPADAQRLLRDYSVSNGQFGINLYKEMINQVENFVISPLSIHSALSMLLLGASGRTKRELLSSMNVRSPIHPAFQAYNQSLDHGVGENATLMMANALYTKTDFNPKPRYLNKLRTFYNTVLQEFDGEDPEGVINDWVKEKTMDMLEDFLSDGEVTDDMVMMLINAVYFKGLWEDAFDEDDTSLGTFTDINSNTHDVYMMRRNGFYNMYHSTILGAHAVKIPYKGGRYSMNLILPDEDKDLTIVEARLTHDLLNQTLGMLMGDRGTKVDLMLPKFGMDTEQSLETLLQALGIREVFQAGRANLRRMTSSRNVVVSKVKHRCMLELDETGTEASAATSVGVVLTSMSLPFDVDRPFMFVLRDDRSGVNLFMGRYAVPGGENMMD